MRLFHLTSYNLYSDLIFTHQKSVKNSAKNLLKNQSENSNNSTTDSAEIPLEKPTRHNLKIFVLSDIHFSYQVKSEKLDKIANFIKNRNPDYIFLPGDLVDSNNMIESESEQNRLLSFLESLGKIAPLFISPGNHDNYTKPPKKRSKFSIKPHNWEYQENREFISKINALQNVHYLSDEIYEDKNIFVLGLNLKPEYYNYDSNPKYKITDPIHENVEELLTELDNLDQKYLKNLPKNKLKFALIHSPVCLDDYRVKAELSEFDYFISGHMHNGCVPPVLDEITPGERGLISPTKNLTPVACRNTGRKNGDKRIVVGAVTSFHECIGVWHNLNIFYPTYLAELNFKNDKKLKRKPYVRKKYYPYG